jgi:hypothetical protein
MKIAITIRLQTTNNQPPPAVSLLNKKNPRRFVAQLTKIPPLCSIYPRSVMTETIEFTATIQIRISSFVQRLPTD